MNFSAAEYTRQVQEAAAYIKEKLNGPQACGCHYTGFRAWETLPNS